MLHVSALFHDEEAAREAVDDLISAGFPRDRISLAMSEETRSRLVPVERTRGSHIGEGVVAGSTLGAIIGGIVAVVSLGVPGGIVVAGPIAALLGGLGLGAAGGGVAGALAGAGLAPDHVERYAERVRDGDILVGVLTSDPTRADIAARTLEAAGARTPPESWPVEEPRVT